MVKKSAKVFLAVMFLILSVTFISCGSKNTNQKRITVSWWGGESRHEATVSAIKAFEKKK